ncbi:elongation factor 1-alpha-like [Hemicordylus capensis]|uniref:elongation factor 1-alpha-like n=1 Tax=Hemicordylus capensis TaxID=884348 RepID=UPI002303EEA5|nr:elongation factor 1-alpha-like [Hemicordylus capensis]
MNKSSLGVLVLGPDDAGKAALTGHLLYRWGGLGPRRMVQLWEQKEEHALTYAQLLECFADVQESEAAPRRPRWHYRSPKCEVAIAASLSAGTLSSFFPSGDLTACVMLLISAAEGEYEAHRELIQKWVCSVCELQVKQIVVCVNKMDSTKPPRHQPRYDYIHKDIWSCFQELGQDPNTVGFLPISALWGDNLQLVGFGVGSLCLSGWGWGGWQHLQRK